MPTELRRCQRPATGLWSISGCRKAKKTTCGTAPEASANPQKGDFLANIQLNADCPVDMRNTRPIFLASGRTERQRIRHKDFYENEFDFEKSRTSERGKEKLGASRGPCRVFSFFACQHNSDRLVSIELGSGHFFASLRHSTGFVLNGLGHLCRHP